MNKIEFENYPSTSTPINAENLNQMQDNIENAVGNIDTSRISAIENKDIEQDGRLDSIEGSRGGVLELFGPNVFRFSGTYVQLNDEDAQVERGYPVAKAGFLEVVGNGDFAMQTYTIYNPGRIQYNRVYKNGIWHSWM